MLRLDKNKGSVLYVQLKSQIKNLIETGVWSVGKSLPPERTLAAQLAVSRTIVSMAYRELAEEGYIKAAPGKGTVVASQPRKNELSGNYQSFIDGVLDRAIQLGIDCSEFATLLSQRVAERQHMAGDLTICFIECNQEQLSNFSKTLKMDPTVKVQPLLISELRLNSANAECLLHSADIVVTTLYHADEVNNIARGKEVVVIEMAPDVQSIIQISRIPAGDKTALVCGSPAFAGRAINLIARAGGDTLDLIITYEEEVEKLRNLLNGIQYVIATSIRLNQVRQVCGPDTQLIELVYRPDQASLRMLTSVIWKRKFQETGSGYRLDQHNRRGDSN